MTHNEFLRLLVKKHKVEIKHLAKHDKLTVNGNSTTFPRHGSKEIGEGLRKAILKQLNLKD